jgi:hypothetical protein
LDRFLLRDIQLGILISEEPQMNHDQALLEMSLLNAEYVEKDSTDLAVECLNFGLPAEIVTRLEELWVKTKKVAGEIIYIGKIIVGKIFDFIRANQNLALGVAIGAAISAIVGMVPFLGVVLGPLAGLATIPAGAYLGIKVDAKKNDSGLDEQLFTIVRQFFNIFAEIFNALKVYFA